MQTRDEWMHRKQGSLTWPAGGGIALMENLFGPRHIIATSRLGHHKSTVNRPSLMIAYIKESSNCVGESHNSIKRYCHVAIFIISAVVEANLCVNRFNFKHGRQNTLYIHLEVSQAVPRLFSFGSAPRSISFLQQ